MKKGLLAFCLFLFSICAVNAQNWSVTLGTADGLPGEAEAYFGSLYSRFTSQQYAPGAPVDKIRLTVLATETNEAPNGNNVIFALSGVTIYDGDGNKVGYTASSNADHNSLSWNGTDGDGLPALSDDDIKSYFHSMWSGNAPVKDYHYVEFALDRSVETFSIEWTTRLGQSKNAPTMVGVTLGTDYVPVFLWVMSLQRRRNLLRATNFLYYREMQSKSLQHPMVRHIPVVVLSLCVMPRRETLKLLLNI